MTKSRKKELSKQYGVTGVSVLYRWYFLCKFDPVNDLVIDVMHVILNLVRTELELLLGRGNQLDESRVVNRSKLADALKYVPWISELKDGRPPTIIGYSDPVFKHHLGHWKTKEFMKFIKVAPYVLHTVAPKDRYYSFYLLHRICQLLLSMVMRVEGWRKEDIDLLNKLLWLHAIQFEQCYGVACCSENLEYSLHLPSDIYRHSSPDNYWCFVYERLVRFYKLQTTNQKTLCKTFADRANQLRFVTSFLELQSSKETTDHNTAGFTSNIIDGFVILSESTCSSALALKEHLSTINMSVSVKEMYSYGILVGTPIFKKLHPRQLADIQYFMDKEVNPEQLPSSGQYFTKLQKTNDCDMAVLFRIGETIILRDLHEEGKEWVMKITHFILYGPVLGKYYIFVDGHYFVAKTKTRGREIDLDSWTRKEKMIPKYFSRLCVQPTLLIDRKVMLYPSPNNHNNPNYYLVIDHEDVDFSPIDLPNP